MGNAGWREEVCRGCVRLSLVEKRARACRIHHESGFMVLTMGAGLFCLKEMLLKRGKLLILCLALAMKGLFWAGVHGATS